ncbi:MAG: hypothetical protein JXR86_01760 [Spirochaetales bacterium]|nr:hypothetical protein [Spirochaetales bacterium]
MKKNIFIILFVLLLNSYVSADEIYRLVGSAKGTLRPGEPVLTIGDNESPEEALAGFLNFENYTIRTERQTSFISPKSGPGFIPVLAFHRIGNEQRLELTLERFEQILGFFKNNKFHVISDLQLIDGDFSFVPDGFSPVVLGCDDSSSGVFYYETVGELKHAPFIMKDGNHIISKYCMVSVLEKTLPLERGRRNFTFYLTFDAIPFRQTGGGYNPGPPYLAMPAVHSKLQYLEKNFYLGNHTLHHYYSEVVSEMEYIFELVGYYDVLTSYGVQNDGRTTLAYSYGIGEITPERQKTVRDFSYNGISIAGAFDYDNEFSRPVDSGEANRYDISRIGVDNGNFEDVLKRLEAADLYCNQRAVLLKDRDYPFGINEYEIDGQDQNFILIGE